MCEEMFIIPATATNNFDVCYAHHTHTHAHGCNTMKKKKQLSKKKKSNQINGIAVGTLDLKSGSRWFVYASM